MRFALPNMMEKDADLPATIVNFERHPADVVAYLPPRFERLQHTDRYTELAPDRFKDFWR